MRDANPLIVAAAKGIAAARGHNLHYVATFHDESQTAVWERYADDASAALRAGLRVPQDALYAALAAIWSVNDETKEAAEREIRRALDQVVEVTEPRASTHK